MYMHITYICISTAAIFHDFHVQYHKARVLYGGKTLANISPETLMVWQIPSCLLSSYNNHYFM